MITRPHEHYCPYCRTDVPCAAIASGGCIFPSTSAVTCERCAAQQTIVANTCPYCGSPYALLAGGCVAHCPASERVKAMIREAIEEDERRDPSLGER